MNVVKKLTTRHLLQNKRRTIITILGICVSVAMITAVFVSVASFLNLMGELDVFSSGSQQALIYDLTPNQINSLKEDERIKRVGCYILEDAQSADSSFSLAQGITSHSSIGDIYVGDENNLNQMITCELDGVIPKNENEIAVEQSFIEKNKLDWSVGDTVTLNIGNRYVSLYGSQTNILGSYTAGEKFKTNKTSEFKITAILHSNNPTSNYSIIRGLSEDERAGTLSASIELKEVNYKSLDVIYSIINSIRAKDYSVNKTFLETKLAIDSKGTLATSIIPMALIILAIIMLASIILIYNAFGMSLSERTKYLGMLASVGATKKQKKQSVYFEGALLGAVGIPVGIIAGIIGISITLKAIGGKIISSGMILGVENSGISMKTVVPLWAIVGIIIFAVLTILISCIIPAKKASSITPIEALRQSKEIKANAKKLKSPKYIRKIFGYEGELAYKNLKRNGAKARVITASIALSVILFLSVNYFCQLLMQSIDMESNVPYQLNVVVNYCDKDSLLSDLENVDGIDNVYSATVNTYYYGKKASEGADQAFANESYLTKNYKNLFNSYIPLYLNIVDDEAFNAICKENGIDYKAFYSSSSCIIMNNINHKNGGATVFNENVLGSTISNASPDKFEVTALFDYDESNYLCTLNPSGVISAYIPEGAYFSADDETPITLGVETKNHSQVTADINNILEENEYSYGFVSDLVETVESMNTLLFVLQVFVYGFIVLITLITIANIINTISTGIDLRRKEFAMLKSVGITPNGFYKMINMESAFYGVRALLASIPISIALSLVMNKTLGSNVIPFEINIKMYLAVIVAVFVIIGVSMLCFVSKLKNDSIAETLKEDIM